MNKPKRGGARQGAGRKPGPGGKRDRLITVKATEQERARFVAVGGSEWLHKTVAAEHERITGA